MTYVRPTAAPSLLLLPAPPTEYDQRIEQQRNLVLSQADAKNRKIGQPIDLQKDLVILTASDGSRWKLTIGTDGTLGTASA